MSRRLSLRARRSAAETVRLGLEMLARDGRTAGTVDRLTVRLPADASPRAVAEAVQRALSRTAATRQAPAAAPGGRGPVESP